MKIRRHKKVSKILSFYINNFRFRQPYQLLVDGTFCLKALKNQVNISDNIAKYLQGEIKVLTTQCAILEMESLGKPVSGGLKVLKQFPLHKCGHEGKPKTGASCLLSMVNNCNEKHYIICTQDRDLQEKLRNKPAVPLLYLHSKAPVLEEPSKTTQDAAKNASIGFYHKEKERIDNLKEISGIVNKDVPKVKKKKIKGPNPLSCKKKRKKGVIGNNPIAKKEAKTETDKHKRTKIRIPKHVKEELLKSADKNVE